MKYGTLFFLFYVFFAFAQKSQPIKFYTSIKDKTKTIRSLEVIDSREEKDLGKVAFKNHEYTFAFDEETVENQFENWFLKSNENSIGTRDLVLLVEKFHFFSEPLKKGDLEKVEIKMSVFEKKFNQYYFLDRINNVILLDPQKAENTPKGFTRYLDGTFSQFLKNSFEVEKKEEKGINENELKEYEQILQSRIPLFVNKQYKDGVYKDFDAFANQKPLVNFELVKNNDGEVVRAKSNEERMSLSKIYAFVDNGKAYRPTIAGNLEILNDEGGFYVVSNRKSLFPEEVNMIYYSFGILGGIAGAIDASVKHDKAMKSDKYNIYLDSVNGNFVFLE